MSRRRLIPEVIQTSAMDCGPACLAALLAGFGVRASYERLREACQTDVDGTSIDTIEEAAIELGLDAAQIIVPVDHVLMAESDALPAIVVTRQPDGGNHFVVAWSVLGGRVQVMDPASGRRWVKPARFLEDLYVHEMDLPADMWREWAAADEFTKPLVRRLVALGVSAGDAGTLVERALVEPSWRSIATLDAATRMVQGFVDAGALSAGATTASLVASLVRDPDAIPAACWSARATEDAATVRVRGAVLVHVAKYTPAKPKSGDLAAALVEPKPRPWSHLVAAVTSTGTAGPLAIVGAVLLTALLVVVQATLWRKLFDTGELTTLQLAGAIGALFAFLVIELAIEALLVDGVFRLGRRVELSLRAQFLGAIRRLGLRYLRSRPVSDMAERSHMLYRLRELPWVGARLARVATTTLATGAALVWLAPHATLLIVGLAAAVIAPPLVAHRQLAERELRVRTHYGAMTRFYLDSLIGVIPARTHGIERALRSAHEARLVEWVRAARREHALASTVAAVQTVLVVGFAIALVAVHVLSTDRPASVLLAVYWTVGMASAGAMFAALCRELPQYRNLTLRLVEPLGMRAEEADAKPAALPAGPLALRFDDVAVVAGGHTVLQDVSLTIAPGEHVAIVGSSGAGKSTLIGLLLGWHVPARGSLYVGDAPLDASVLAALRRRTAWVDPAVQLWNDSLAANIGFGVGGVPDLGATVNAAQLDTVLGRLPEGMQTRLGESGGLLSGGEGQRVRLGRGLARRDASLVVLDEPFRGIDRERRRELLDAARTRWHGVTLICATHDLAETRTFDRVLVVDGGRIVDDGVPAELAARADSRYAQLLHEEAVAHELWSHWRRVRLDGGRVAEAAARAEEPA
jgi:ATP-binding cassette subfamily B protein